MAGNGREALPDVRKLLAEPPRMSGSDLEAFPYVRVVRRPSQMFGSGREAISNVREWSGDPPGCP